MPSPIGTLVATAGTDAQITVYAADTSADYDPTDNASFVPGAATPTGIRVVPSKLFKEMLDRGLSGHFLAETLPAGVVAGSSKLTFDTTTYLVQKLRKRWYMGLHDGWSLECTV